MLRIAEAKIIAMVHKGSSVTDILRALRADFPYQNFCYGSVRRMALRIRASMLGMSGPVRKLTRRKFTEREREEISAEIENAHAHDSGATSTTIKGHLRHRKNISISCSYLRRLRIGLGYRSTAPKYCQLIRNHNKEVRMRFCQESILKRESFNDVVFTDEATFQITNNNRIVFTKKGDFHRRLVGRAKHPAKIHVWAGISKRGATTLVTFPGTVRMNSELYTQILQNTYIPFVKGHYAGCARLAQDNAPTHVSRFTTSFLNDNGLATIKWPPESPDLNPIELVWGNMKNWIAKMEVKPRNSQELKATLEKLWFEKVDEAYCRKLVDGLHWRMQRVIKARGCNINENKKAST